MPELVSIIMPAYNAEKYIAESIRSVLGQTYQDWELIVVDDGSTDRTAEVVRPFCESDARVKYVFQENGRLGKARNTGIKNSSGQLIAFLDSDDLWLPEKLELQVKTIRETGADLVFTECFVFTDDDVTDESKTFKTPSGKFQGPELVNLLLLRNRLAVLSVLLRREGLEKVGPFEEGKPFHGCEDYDLWLRLAKSGMTFYGMEQALVRYRRHASAMTHLQSDALKPMILVVQRHLKDGTLGEKEARGRVRGLYRDLISALVEEGKMDEARSRMRELSALDRSGIVTSIQKVLIKVLPSKYNFISRELLYRTEWHVSRLFG